MYTEILVATDGSGGSAVALEHAFELATQFEATLHVVYVLNTTNSPLGLDNVLTDVHNPPGESLIEEIVQEAREQGLSVEGHVLKGIPHETIVEYAIENEIDLIVLATHGRSGVVRGMLGSVTENVIRRSEIPVLTVRITTPEG